MRPPPKNADPQPEGQSGSHGPAGPQGKQGPTGPLTGAAGGDLMGKYPNPFIGDAKIITSALAEGAVTAPKLGAGAVTNEKLADGSVTTTKIAANQVRAGNVAPIVPVSKELSLEKEVGGTAEVECPAKMTVVSGGFDTLPKTAAASSTKRVGNGWEATVRAGASATVLTVFAYCMEA